MLRLLAVAALLLPFAAAAQDLPIRWGDLSDAETALDAWPGDPDAAAVILGDVGLGEVRLTRARGLTFRLRRHRRVKVLSEEGYAQGEFRFRYPDERGTSVRDVRGQTFVPEGDVAYRRVELDGGDVFDERVAEGVREVRFSMPALAPGAIVEFSYTYETEAITQLPTWTFQSAEPTLASEVRFETPIYFEFVHLARGSHVQAFPARDVNTLDYRTTERRWVARDVPALRDEPYTTTEADYVEKLDIQLSLVNWPDRPFERVLSSWPEVAEGLWGHPRFGAHLGGSRRVREIAAAFEGTAGEKARALYGMVRRDYVWDGTGGIFAQRGLDDVIESRSGSEAELTILLLALLDAAGVPATPVVLSGRSNGRAIVTYPIVGQFDTVLALVQVPDEPPALLSPLSPHRPYGEVPVDALNGDAWMVDREAPQWISFGAPSTTATTTAVRATLDEDGGLSGELQVRLAGYDAFDARERLAEAEAESATDEAVSESADAADDTVIEVVEVTGVEDVTQDLDLTATLSATAAETVGDEMYLSPFVAMQLDENPFEREARTFPVDYGYPFTRTYVAQLALPDGWQAVDLPPALSLAIPSRRVHYQRFVSADDGGLTVRAVLTVTGGQVVAAEYPALRELYDEIVATEAEALVLARTAPPASEAVSEPSDDGAEAEEAGGR